MKQTTTHNSEFFNDMRGTAYEANKLQVIKNRLYYAGSPISDLVKDGSCKSAHYYNIIQYGTNVATIALSAEDYKIAYELLNPIDFTRINNDANGNPRFVCHFLAFIGDKDREIELSQKYELALRRSRQLGGRKFHNKQYGGGIVFQMYDGQQLEMSRKIREIANS